LGVLALLVCLAACSVSNYTVNIYVENKPVSPSVSKSAANLTIILHTQPPKTMDVAVNHFPTGLAPLPPPPLSWRYRIPANAMPWLSQPGGLNSAYHFGQQDGAPPVVLTFASLHAAPGDKITVRFISGDVSTGGGSPPMDGSGFPNPNDVGGLGWSGQPMPNAYMSPYPINVGSIVGTFATDDGTIVGHPFALGDGPTTKTIPSGAAQLQLGINDDIYADNTGSDVVSVTLAHPGN